ncbi:MAG: hypothetical protein WBN75_17505 [Verrucomicrobiia bacterium]|jgi:hypothetical protein
MCFPWYHSIIQLHLRLAEPCQTHLAPAMPVGATMWRKFAKRPIYKGFPDIKNLMPAKDHRHLWLFLPSRQDFRQLPKRVMAVLRRILPDGFFRRHFPFANADSMPS